MKFVIVLSAALVLAACASASKNSPAFADSKMQEGEAAIQKMAGCYLVDYNYAETQSLKKGYARDARLYDVNTAKTVKEWIYSERISPTRIRLQHVLFSSDAKGNLVAGSELKHQAEDWEFQAPFLYEFQRPNHWEVKRLPADSALWTRRVTNLDDGLRYQCAAAWQTDTATPQWTCDNYAPIPGRETRDMGRKDYQALQRSTRLVVYGDHWLERQENVKTIDKNGVRTPLAKEAGKNWYIRLPDSECTAMKDWASSRREFWALLRETWDFKFDGQAAFVEKAQMPPRWAKMMAIEAEYLKKDLSDPKVRDQARSAILAVIESYREPAGAAKTAAVAP